MKRYRPALDEKREGGPLTPSWCVTCDDVPVPHVRDEGHECTRPVVSAVFADPLAICKDCGKPTDAGPCPLCGALVCELCAEREGSFCCPDGTP